jgi:hypothetical protein
MNLPTSDAVYVSSVEEVLWGAALIAITMAIHGFGMLLVLRTNLVFKHWFQRVPSFTSGIVVLILASWMILLVHFSEVLVWATFFLWKGAFPNHSIAYYFSLNEYTTVGSNYNLPFRWRLLEGMIATAGLLAFAWSTGILLTLAQDFQEQQIALFKQRQAQRRHPAPHPAGGGKPAGNRP